MVNEALLQYSDSTLRLTALSVMVAPIVAGWDDQRGHSLILNGNKIAGIDRICLRFGVDAPIRR